jgi:hypothetical protein
MVAGCDTKLGITAIPPSAHQADLRVQQIDGLAVFPGDSASRELSIDELPVRIILREKDQRLPVQGPSRGAS